MSKLYFLLLSCVCMFKAGGQAGSLDSTFGNNGIQATANIHFTCTAIQGNKIIAAGYALNQNNDNDFALARYTNEGILDSSFGKNGTITTDFNNTGDNAYSITLQGDKIILAGYTYNGANSDFALARYTADGTLDASFGNNGKVVTDFNGLDDGANAIALQGDKIIVAGYANNNTNLALSRYTADGALDASFGENGKVVTEFEGYFSYANASAIVLQGDKIIAAGYAGNQTNNFHADFALARFTGDGMLDSSFGVNGKLTTQFNHITNVVNSVVLQGNKIIAVGSTNDLGIDFLGNVSDYALASYTADGISDTTFGVNGKLTTDFNNSNDEANSSALQGDRIIVAGSSGTNIDFPVKARDFSLTRYTADGTLDSSFGVNGKVITGFNGDASIKDIALYGNRLYAVGSLTTNPDTTYGIVAAYQLETPAPAISIADVAVTESKKEAVVTVNLSAPATQPVRVSYTTRDKTATDHRDYLGVKDTLLFNPGATTATISITIIDDSLDENNEQLEVLLTSASNATIEDSIAEVTIIDDDTLVTTQDSSFHIIASPNPSNGTFAVQVQGIDYNQPVSIRVFDMSGRLIEQRANITIGQHLRLGVQYLSGTYIIEARQGSLRTHTKVIKAGM